MAHSVCVYNRQSRTYEINNLRPLFNISNYFDFLRTFQFQVSSFSFSFSVSSVNPNDEHEN